MIRKLCVFTAFIVLVALTGCSYESRQTTLHKPGVYKGTKDQLLPKQHEQILIDRFKLVQSDRD
jgi:ABC-type uncharacterized transport system auxiliary subunit